MAISSFISLGIGPHGDIRTFLTGGLTSGVSVAEETSSYIISQGIGSPASIAFYLTGGLGDFAAVEIDHVVYPDFLLQMALDPENPDDWTDITDIRGTEPVIVEYGISGNSPTDRIANAGKLTWALDNSEHNSAARVGYYSKLHALKRTGFDLNIPVRFALSCADVDAFTYYKFRGRLDSAPADPGELLQRITHCTALDLMDDWANTAEPDLDAQIGKRSDELVTTLLDAVDADLQPVARDVETGLETYPFAFDGGTGQRLTIRERLNQIALSEFGKIFIKGDTTGGGTFAFHNRQHGPLDPTIKFTLDNDMALADGVVLDTSRAQVYRSVQVTVHPTNIVADEPFVVLYSLKSTQIYIGPGETNTSLFGPYRDPDTNDQIGGTDIQGLVAGTDYVMNSSSDGSGSDVTASFTVSPSATGSGVRWTLSNGGDLGGWIQVLQIKGRPIRRSTLLLEVTVPGGYGRQSLEIEMPYQSNANVGSDVATYLAMLLSTPSAQIKSVRFLANWSSRHMAAALQLEPGDRVAISEAVTGVSDAETVINGVRLELEQGGLLWCTWTLDAISATHYWLLGSAGASELGQTTLLGI